MIGIEHHEGRNLLFIRVSGVLTSHDYEHAVPELENAMKLMDGPVRLMIRFEDFQGWQIDALYREMQFGLEKRGEFGRVALVCETSLQEWASALSAPFAKAEVKNFSTGEEEDAEAWLLETPGQARAQA